MNSTKPLEPLPPPAATKTLPTIGSVFGSVVGSFLTTKMKLDPLSAASLIAGCTALATAAFHWLGSKLGVPL